MKRPLAPTLTAAATLLALAGCRVGPKYVRPVVPTFQAPTIAADAWKEATPDWHPAQPADAALKGDWWTLFGDPDLSLLEVKAGIQNQQLQAYAARYTEARAQIGINEAARLPTLGVQPAVQGVRFSTGRPFVNQTNLANAGIGTSDIQLPLTLNYEVDLFGRIRRGIAAAKEEAQAAAADEQNVQLSIQTELAIDYFEVRSADSQIKLLNNTVKDYQEALRITTNRFEGGVVAESDVFQARTQLQTAVVLEQDAAVQRARYEHAIAVLIGQPPSSFSLAAQPLTGEPPPIPVALPSALLERRPDIAAAERRTAAANERIGIARAAFFPTLLLSAAAGLEAAAPQNLFGASQIFYALGPVLGYTYFDNGRRRNVSVQAQAFFDESSANYRQTALTAYQQVEDNLAALRILASEAEQQHQATVAAQGAQKIFDNRYVGGIDTYLQVVTAQQAALTNERNEIDIQRRRMDASVLLVKALGGGWSTANLPQYR